MRYKEGKLYGWLGADFPPSDTKVLLFLDSGEGGTNKYTLYGDLNNIGVINKDETVNLYKGAKVNEMTPKDYEIVYTKFLKDKYKESDSVNRKTDVDRNSNFQNRALLADL